MNGVRYLKYKTNLTSKDRLLAKTLGRPRPELCISQQSKDKQRSFTRTFNIKSYDKCEWICGCPVANAYFCFPCILFGGDCAWTKIGVKDLKHLSRRMKDHGLSKRHVDNEISLELLGKNIRLQLDDGHRLSVRNHNESVDRNRYIVSRIIDSMKFCGEFELSLKDRDKTEHSHNVDVLEGLINNYASTIISVLKDDDDDGATVFKWPSKTIQNELLDAMLSICQEHIADEINKVAHLSFQADELRDGSGKTQIVLILRYQIDGIVHERFWCLFEAHDRSASGLAGNILEELSELGVNKSPEKLICQSYEGASFMTTGGSKGGVQSLVREKYPNANRIHCYAHRGNRILQNAISFSNQSRMFFQDIQGIGEFFTRSPKSFVECLQRKLGSTTPPTRWHLRTTVNTVYENKDSLIECFERIIRDTVIKDEYLYIQAAGLVQTLKDPRFLFWLTFYNEVMAHVASFFDAVQHRNVDSTRVREVYEYFCDAVSNVRKMYDEKVSSTSEPAMKRRCGDSNYCTAAAREVCDSITNYITDRFQCLDHISASKLFYVKNFEEYRVNFPVRAFQSIVLSSPTINSQQLRTQLEVLYARTELRVASGAAQLLQLILGNNMSDIFSECVPVLMKILTIPMPTVESERCFSTLKRIKTFLRNTMGAESLTALAMLSLEMGMINCIPEFNKRVIDKFAETEERAELIYRH